MRTQARRSRRARAASGSSGTCRPVRAAPAPGAPRGTPVGPLGGRRRRRRGGSGRRRCPRAALPDRGRLPGEPAARTGRGGDRPARCRPARCGGSRHLARRGLGAQPGGRPAAAARCRRLPLHAVFQAGGAAARRRIPVLVLAATELGLLATPSARLAFLGPLKRRPACRQAHPARPSGALLEAHAQQIARAGRLGRHRSRARHHGKVTSVWRGAGGRFHTVFLRDAELVFTPPALAAVREVLANVSDEDVEELVVRVQESVVEYWGRPPLTSTRRRRSSTRPLQRASSIDPSQACTSRRTSSQALTLGGESKLPRRWKSSAIQTDRVP